MNTPGFDKTGRRIIRSASDYFNRHRSVGLGMKQTTTTHKPLIRKDNWMEVVGYVKMCADVRESLCVGCGKGCLYDKNEKKYLISRFTKMDDLKKTIEEIREINKA